MSTISLLARNCTLFTTTKALDEDAYRKSLQRFVEFKIGPFLASGGSGEANSLSWDEVRRVYQIGVEVCRGKVPVYANMPEVRSAQEAIDFYRLWGQLRLAIMGWQVEVGFNKGEFTDVRYGFSGAITLRKAMLRGSSLLLGLLEKYG